MQKKIVLTLSEINNADSSYNGKKYTIINRPWICKGRKVSAVYLDGEVISSMIVPSKCCVKDAINEILRMMDKCAQGGDMASSSRLRHTNKLIDKPL